MNTFDSPYTFFEAEIALFYAYENGTPLRDPTTLEIKAPAASCIGSISISSSPKLSEGSLGDWQGRAKPTEHKTWRATVSYQDGAWREQGERISSILSSNSDFILMIRFHDEVNGNWDSHQFHYCSLDSQESSHDPSNSTQSFTLQAGHRETFSGNTSQAALPELTPQVLGRVEWIQAGNVVPCLFYDPFTETWSESGLNSFTVPGESPKRYCEISPDPSNANETYVKMLIAATTEQTPTGNQQVRTGITYETSTCFTIGNHNSPTNHGIRMGPGFALQKLGCPEPIRDHVSATHWQHPRLVFRYLKRIYCTISQGVVAVPSITPAALDIIPALDDPFLIAPTSGNNPATGYTGITLLPETAILDGIEI